MPKVEKMETTEAPALVSVAEAAKIATPNDHASALAILRTAAR
jgi:hypothetical protein